MGKMNFSFLYTCALFCALTEAENIRDYICSQHFAGYKIDYAHRKCEEGKAVGCTNPFPYKTLEECEADFRGRGNICDSALPCRHGGACLPVTTDKGRTFKCDCSATGFYGSRCQRKCPTNLSKRQSKQTACIQIG